MKRGPLTKVTFYDHYQLVQSEHAWLTADEIAPTIPPDFYVTVDAVGWVIAETNTHLVLAAVVEAGGVYSEDPGHNLIEVVVKSCILSREELVGSGEK